MSKLDRSGATSSKCDEPAQCQLPRQRRAHCPSSKSDPKQLRPDGISDHWHYGSLVRLARGWLLSVSSWLIRPAKHVYWCQARAAEVANAKGYETWMATSANMVRSYDKLARESCARMVRCSDSQTRHVRRRPKCVRRVAPSLSRDVQRDGAAESGHNAPRFAWKSLELKPAHW